MHHSDQGVQFFQVISLNAQSTRYSDFSSLAAGVLGENGYAERLIRTLKEEEVHLNDYQDITEARERIGQFITQGYHQQRLHAALGYLTPLEFQRQNLS